MKITLTQHDGTKTVGSLAFAQAEVVDFKNLKSHCGGEHLVVRGGEPTIDYDTYTSKAVCAACGEHLGELKVKVSTLFGIEEDRRVLNGRYRVY